MKVTFATPCYISAVYPELNYVPDGPPGHPQAHLHWRFFDRMVDLGSGRYLSEDYAFCRRWRDMGVKVFADLDTRWSSIAASVSSTAILPKASAFKAVYRLSFTRPHDID